MVDSTDGSGAMLGCPKQLICDARAAHHVLSSVPGREPADPEVLRRVRDAAAGGLPGLQAPEPGGPEVLWGVRHEPRRPSPSSARPGCRPGAARPGRGEAGPPERGARDVYAQASRGEDTHLSGRPGG